MKFLAKLPLVLTLSLVGLLAFAATASAAAAIDPTDGGQDLAKLIYDAFSGGHYLLAACALVIVAVAMLRKYAGERFAWVHSDQGSAALVLITSFAGALLSALSSGGDVTLHLFYTALIVAFSAAGGYAALKKLVVEPLAPRLPAWLQPAVVWLFQHASDPSKQPAPAVEPASPSPPTN